MRECSCTVFDKTQGIPSCSAGQVAAHGKPPVWVVVPFLPSLRMTLSGWNKPITAMLRKRDDPADPFSAAIITASGTCCSVGVGTAGVPGSTVSEASDEMVVELRLVAGRDGIGKLDDAASITNEEAAS